MTRSPPHTIALGVWFWGDMQVIASSFVLFEPRGRKGGFMPPMTDPHILTCRVAVGRSSGAPVMGAGEGPGTLGCCCRVRVQPARGRCGQGQVWAESGPGAGPTVSIRPGGRGRRRAPVAGCPGRCGCGAPSLGGPPGLRGAQTSCCQAALDGDSRCRYF